MDVGGRPHREYGLYFISLYSSRLGLSTSPLDITLGAVDIPVQWRFMGYVGVLPFNFKTEVAV